MLKLLLCLIFIVCSTFLGNWFSLKLSRRSNDLYTVLEAISKIKNHITFQNMEVDRVVALAFESYENFYVFTQDNDNLNFTDWWQKSVNCLSDTTALNKEDRKILLKFGENLGVTDLEGQISNCELYINLIEERYREAKNTENKNVRLYRLLGFSLGCTVSLMVV